MKRREFLSSVSVAAMISTLPSASTAAMRGNHQPASIEDICQWFGVPPHKITHLARSTNNDIERLRLAFIRDTLPAWADRIAKEPGR